jgi:hypothetical protein
VAALPIGNIYAPPWMCLSPGIANYDDVEFDIDLPSVTVAANSIQLGTPTNFQTLTLDADYDFLCREIQFVVFPPAVSVQPSDLRVRIRDAFGRLVTSDFVQVQNLNGVLPFIWGLKLGGVLTFDFQNVNAAHAISVQTVLKGWKRKSCPGKPALVSPYVPMYKRYSVPIDQGVKLEDFEYYFTFTATAAIDRLRIPLQTDQDADFLWRAQQGDWNTSSNDVAVVGSVGLLFYDPTETPISGGPNPEKGTNGLINPWGSFNVGQFRESILSSGGGNAAPMYPEILIKAGGVVSVDLSFGGPATVRFSLRGMKIYREGC